MKKVNLVKWNAPKTTFFVFLFLFFILFLQFLYLSLGNKIYGKNMEEFAAKRSTVNKVITANRGSIYDKDGSALAINVSSYTLIAYLNTNRKDINGNPDYVENIDGTANELAQVLNCDSSILKTTLENGKNSNKYQVEFGSVGKGITELTKTTIEELNLQGIDFVESQKRFYPNGDFASYIIGYAKNSNSDDSNSDIKGELGIELEYNDILKGKDGYLKYQQDRYGYKIVGTNEEKKDAENGYDIYLTLDSTIQRFIESAIDKTEESYNPEWMTITVMNAKTGDILGSGSSPSYDPNQRNLTSYENPLISYVYEPGSTMKIYTYMCAMENNKYDGNKTFQSGSITIYDKTVNDWIPEGWGMISFDKGFEYSSNVGVANLILNNNISNAELKKCLSDYGFGKKTNVELSRELSGNLDFNYKIELVNAGFGQGITTTAIQQLQAASIIANDGKYVKPHIVDKIVNPNNGNIYYESKTELSEQKVKKSTVNKMKELMYNAIHGTDPGTAAHSYNIDGFDLIGKTGTAQIYNSQTGSYSKGENNYIFSFIGMYPKDEPEIIIYGSMKRPTSMASRGLRLAITEVLKNTEQYLDIYGNYKKDDKLTTYTIESYKNKKTDIIKQKLDENNLKYTVIGNGDKIINQYPIIGQNVTSSDKIILVTNGNEYNMPNISGWSKNDIIEFCKLLDIKYTINGYGYATTQNIAPNTKIEENMTLEVNLSSGLGE